MGGQAGACMRLTLCHALPCCACCPGPHAGEVARRFGLGADLVTSQLAARLGTLLQGTLEGGVIYTPAYLARIKVCRFQAFL